MNKFRGLQGMEQNPNPIRPGPVLGFSEGFRGDLLSRDSSPNSPFDLVDVKWVKDGIRVDYGRERFVSAAGTIVGIGVRPNFPSYELFRIEWDGSNLELYTYSIFTSSWTLSDEIALGGYPGYPAILATQLAGDKVLIAGENFGILEWDHSTDTIAAVADAPQPRAIISFGDRIVAGGDYSIDEPSALSWTADGIYNDWLGVDSGQIYLLDTTIEIVDPINGFAVVGDNILAVIRQGSIYRAFETGNVDQAMAAVPWIEGIGTHARRTIAQVPGGAIFFGTDSNVYFLSSGNISPIGEPIQDRLKNFYGFDSDSSAAYSDETGEYALCIRSSSAGLETWVIDVDDAQKGKPRWRKTSWTAMNVFGEKVGSLEGPFSGFVFSDDNDEIWKYSESSTDVNGVTFEGEWTTHPLFSDDAGFEHEVKGLAIEYESAGDWAIEIDVSVNGDGTWDNTIATTLPDTTGKSPQIHKVWFDRAGPRMTLRFRIPSESGVSNGPAVLHKYIPLVRRGKGIFR